jgi:hypothetical protein
MTVVALLPFVFFIFLMGSCWYAVTRGGTDEHVGAAIMFVGAFLSWPAETIFGSQWTSPEYGVFAVDLLILIALFALTFRSSRFWPLWATSFQVIAVVTHLATMADHLILPRAYAIAQPFWAYPALLALVLGTRAVNKVAEPH